MPSRLPQPSRSLPGPQRIPAYESPTMPARMLRGVPQKVKPTAAGAICARVSTCRSAITRLQVCGLGLIALVIAGGSTSSSVADALSFPSDSAAVFQVVTPPLVVPCKNNSLQLSIETPGEIDCVDKAVVESTCVWTVPILECVEQGTKVRKGDVVMTLDASDLMTRAQKERIDVVEAQADVDRYRERLALQKLTNESRLAKQKLALEFAELDLLSYRDGELPRAKSAQSGVVELARESVVRSQERFDYFARLAEKGYESPVEVDKERIKLRKAEHQFAIANDKLDLLRNHIEHRSLVELEAKVVRFRDELARAEAEATIALRAREIDVVFREQRLKSQVDYLARLEEGIAACTVRAPRSGRVIVSRPRSTRDADRSLMPGDVVYRRQSLFEVPRFDELNVTVKIHETQVRYVTPGQRVEVRVDARPNTLYAGEVISVSSVPTSATYPNYDLKVYPTVVRMIADPEEIADLRPGMTAHALIVAEERNDCRSVPSQSIVHVGGSPSVFVFQDDNVELRPVEVGLTTSTKVEIIAGLEEGEEVVLSPRTELSEELVELWRRDDEQRSNSQESTALAMAGSDG